MASLVGRGRRSFGSRHGVSGCTSSSRSAIAVKASCRTAGLRGRVLACPTPEDGSRSCTDPRLRRSRSQMLPAEAFGRDFCCLSTRVFWNAMSEIRQLPVPNVMSAPAIGTVRVLIVDDEPLARDCMRLALHDVPGVTIVAECGDGNSAVEAIHRHGPDVVLLDVQ